jgi:hypothetical protein
MSDAAREPDGRRRPHTFYLTDALWDELDRRHHEERARVGSRATKNEFIERALRLGLAALAGEPAQPLAERPTAAGERLGALRAARPARRDPLEELRRASAPGRPAPIASAADQAGDATAS